MSALFPGIWEYLTRLEYEDGKARQVSTVLIFYEDGAAKVCLNDRDTSQVAWSSGGTIQEALEALEAKLQQGHAEWRVRREWKGAPAKARK